MNSSTALRHALAAKATAKVPTAPLSALERSVKANSGPRASGSISGGAMTDVIAKVIANTKPSPPAGTSRAMKAMFQNKLGVDSTDGRTIRDDRSTSPEFTDAATTHRRQNVDISVQEAVGQLTARKSRRDPTAEEIRAETGAPARDADSVIAIIRASRKLS
jgi:hypothetical protein